MIKTYQIYKKDKWNMMNVEVSGRRIIVRDISDDWGEECHTFLSRPALIAWVEKRFPEYLFDKTERDEIMNTFKQI